ncbi:MULTISPECIES: hypothetical protein [Planktothricoides]|uniref:Uncharacterized protein n=1 Tax=Planktothricoides raciborskii FACHB-1370 TaxID=2949576 RepID=A0ABR8EBF7_9CYAN|nr:MULTISPECIES: hypothetical protein [Planktothricoides]MBD2543642.1 hypothetical protein [Planktothricoides raciborskii FACHB-1370]MBD2582466.1 hypothetical protein [Planktothricoides raciborskii FACHB-1261]
MLPLSDRLSLHNFNQTTTSIPVLAISEKREFFRARGKTKPRAIASEIRNRVASRNRISIIKASES